MCVVGARVTAEEFVRAFTAQQDRDMLARMPGKPPEGQRVGMADRLVDVPAGGIQRVDEGGLIEHKAMTGDAGPGRRRQDPSLLRELRLVEDDRESVQISAVMG